MLVRRSAWFSACAAALLVATASPQATTVMQLNLNEMVQRAAGIYRGTVLSATSGIVSAGGGQLPITTYRLRVEETFRGEFPTVKGIRVAEIRMLGKFTPVQRGSLRSFPVLPRMPELAVGQTYLLFTTRASAIGLSTTVGLGQGLFRIGGVGKSEIAVNEANNSGLFRDMAAPTAAPGIAARRAAPSSSAGGPLPYAELASRIESLVQR